MFRLLVALLGLALFGALFAGIYYAPQNVERRTQSPFNLMPGEVLSDFKEPSIAGGEVVVNITVVGPPIDLWVMDQEWLETVIDTQEQRFNLSRPFNYHSQWSIIGLSGHRDISFIADGKTRLALVLDHSDAYYNDTVPSDDAGVANVFIQTRYLEEEQKSLVWGYIAAVPSVVLVALTLARKVQRRRSERRDRRAP